MAPFASEDTPLQPDDHSQVEQGYGGKQKEKNSEVRQWKPPTNFFQHLPVLALGVILLLCVLHRKEDTFSFPTPTSEDEHRESSMEISVAFLGNSMFYFNDFPRFFQELSDISVKQDSCLHGGASISSLVHRGNAMYPQFMTKKSILGKYNGKTIYDFGACTTKQLLLGYDEALMVDHPETSLWEDSNTTVNFNPCKRDANYLSYAIDHYQQQNQELRRNNASNRTWDFVLINDNTRNPARKEYREHGLQTLEEDYVPWLLETGSTPVFLWTQAYSVESTEERNMTGLEDVANFTSLTYAGYLEYKRLLEVRLPQEQAPRIAPVGLGYLMVHEEYPELWHKMFHSDHIHASPLGTFLQGCIVHHTLTGHLPPFPHDRSNNNKKKKQKDPIRALWKHVRMMQHAWEPPNPFPTREEAAYLYNVAERITSGEVPSSFILYEHGETAYLG